MRAKRIRSSSITSSRAFTTARSSTSSIRARRARRSGPTAGSGSTSAPTSRWPTRVGREILAAGLENRAFIERATSGFDEYRACVEPYTLETTEQITRVPAALIRELAHAYATRRARATLLDARHHRASQRRRQRPRADQSRAAHRSRRPLRLRTLSAARSEQRAGRRRHGRDSRTSSRAGRTSKIRPARAKFERAWDVEAAARARLESQRDVRRDRARRARHALHHRRESGAVRSRSASRGRAAAAA